MKLYTTSEYIDEMKVALSESLLQGIEGQLIVFSNQGAAEYDAQWLVDSSKREGKRVKRPVVYQVKLVRVPLKKARKAKP